MKKFPILEAAQANKLTGKRNGDWQRRLAGTRAIVRSWREYGRIANPTYLHELVQESDLGQQIDEYLVRVERERGLDDVVLVAQGGEVILHEPSAHRRLR